MKFLIDVCTGKSIGDFLKSKEHDVSFVRDRNPKMDDEDILAWALKKKES